MSICSTGAPNPQSAFAGKDPDEILWGVAAIAAEIGLPIRKARWQVESGHLTGIKKIGKQYAGTRRNIRANFEAEVA
jgi:hypothetical protein